MTGPLVTPDPRILANLQRLKDAGAPDEAMEAYLAEENAKPATPQARQLHARDVARRMTSANEMDAAQLPDYTTQVLGGISSLARDIPGAEAAQAGARSLFRGQPYGQALSDIRGAEADNPASGFNRVAGGMVGAVAMPGSPAMAGGAYGALSGLLGADPNQTMTDRLKAGAKEAVVGAAAGKVADTGLTFLRGMRAPTLGASTMARDAARSAASDAAYGTAAAEGRMATHSPALDAALDSPAIKPYADMIRSSPKFASADQSEVARETYKLLSRQQGGLAQKLKNDGFDAALQLQHDNLGSAKQDLLAATDAVMPSFRAAIDQHRAAMGVKDAAETAAQAAKRLIAGTHVAAKRVATQSPEAFKAAIENMTEDQAKGGIEGVLGRLGEYNHLSKNPLKLFGVPALAANANRVAPSLGLLDQIAGTGVKSKAARSAIVSGLLSLMH